MNDFEHGNSGYRKACKCAVCKKAHAAYTREKRRRLDARVEAARLVAGPPIRYGP